MENELWIAKVIVHITLIKKRERNTNDRKILSTWSLHRLLCEQQSIEQSPGGHQCTSHVRDKDTENDNYPVFGVNRYCSTRSGIIQKKTLGFYRSDTGKHFYYYDFHQTN